MSNVPFAAVTVLDGATCVGPLGATIVGLDYRWAGDLTNQVTYAYSNSSAGGAGESLIIQVSPDYDIGAQSTIQAMAMWATHTIVSGAGGAGVISGPWGGVRAYKLGSGSNAKLVMMVAGGSKNRTNKQG